MSPGPVPAEKGRVFVKALYPWRRSMLQQPEQREHTSLLQTWLGMFSPAPPVLVERKQACDASVDPLPLVLLLEDPPPWVLSHLVVDPPPWAPPCSLADGHACAPGDSQDDGHATVPCCSLSKGTSQPRDPCSWPQSRALRDTGDLNAGHRSCDKVSLLHLILPCLPLPRPLHLHGC